MLEEPQLNGRIASVINKLTNSAGWRAREELRGALRGPKTKPDVLITRARTARPSCWKPSIRPRQPLPTTA